MKMSVMLIIALLIVGGSAMFALDWKILIYPAAWAVVGTIFFVWNMLLGPSVPATHDSGSADGDPS